MKRIFVAVDISSEARRNVAAYIETLRKEFREVRTGWDKPEKLHLTLKFLGDTSEIQLTELQKIVAKISGGISNFKLQIAETGVFPNARNARVLWIDVKDEAGKLAKINALLEAECKKIGFAKEKRKFVPHLTIGRVREPHRAGELAKKHLKNEFEPVEFEISEIVIYESKLLPAGSVYSVVSKHELE
ncbi:MAG TPA: RNA 2',3'-cyclic phosphodiesterase [Pyrinomonadaceae bacterium]|jgi:2'-5' RNA ligase|nr:RNA 2',3'-cyclic phosphodiesterase [Pyrinomonadaceae bacterium]